MRACDRLTRAASEHKTRIKDLVRQLLPMTPLIEDIGVADLAVLERWADPRTLLKIGPSRLKSLIVKASHNHHGAERAEQWRSAAAAAVELYGEHPAVAWQDLAAEVATEVRLLKATQAELAVHSARREQAYRWADHGQLARSLARDRQGRRTSSSRGDWACRTLPNRCPVQVLRRVGTAGQ